MVPIYLDQIDAEKVGYEWLHKIALENFKEYNKEDLDVLDQDSKNYLRVIYGKSPSDLSDRFVIYLKTLGCVDPKIHTITVGD